MSHPTHKTRLSDSSLMAIFDAPCNAARPEANIYRYAGIEVIEEPWLDIPLCWDPLCPNRLLVKSLADFKAAVQKVNEQAAARSVRAEDSAI